MGSFCGLIFSIMDIEVNYKIAYFNPDQDIKNFYRLERKLMVEERICMPIAGLFGAIGGVINEFLRI